MFVSTHRPSRPITLLVASFLGLSFFLLLPSVSHAQQDAGQILRQLQESTPSLKRPDKEVIDRTPILRPEVSDLPDLRMEVKGFQISGMPEEDAAAVQQELQRFIGPEKTFQDLLEAAALVKRHLNSQGYLLAQAYIPEQKMQGGVVEIAVLLGRLGKIELNYDEATAVPRARIQAYLDHLEEGKVLRTAQLERVLFLINDLHGVQAISTLRPGADPGSADLVVDVKPDSRLSGHIQFDNQGSRFTGSRRASAGVNLGSPLGFGDSLSLRGMLSERNGIQFGSLSYILPLGSDGWRFGLLLSKLKYSLLENEGVTKGSGTANDVMGYLLYPLLRSRNVNLFLQAGYDYKTFVDAPEVGQAIDRQSRALLLTLSGDLRDSLFGGGINNFSLAYTQGTLRNPTATLDVPTGKFRRINPTYSRLQALGDSDFLLYFRYSGQIALDRLDSSEKFSLGGPSAVRAYPVGEAPSDTAHLASLELRYRIPDWDGRIPGTLIGLLFADWARAIVDKAPPIETTDPPNIRKLSGYGFGFNWALANSWSAQTSFAWRERGTLLNDKKDKHPRIYFQLTRNF